MNRFVARAWMAVVVVAVVGFLMCVYLWQQQHRMAKRYRDHIGLLKTYVRDVQKIPTQEEVIALEKHKEFLDGQLQLISVALTGDDSLAKAYADVVSPLEFRQLLADVKDRLGRAKIGFDDFETKIPDSKNMPELKRHLALVEMLLQTARKNNIATIYNVARLPKRDIFSDKTLIFTAYPVLISMQAKLQDMWSYLYAVTAMGQMVLIEGIRVQSRADDVLDVDIKVSYVEMASV